MSFTSPFGNIIEPDFNPNSSQLPQNQKAKATAQPSQSQSQSPKPKPMALPEPTSPEAFSIPDFNAMIKPVLFAAPKAETATAEYTPEPFTILQAQTPAPYMPVPFAMSEAQAPMPAYIPFAMPMAQALPVALPQPIQLPQLPQQVQNPNRLIFV